MLSLWINPVLADDLLLSESYVVALIVVFLAIECGGRQDVTAGKLSQSPIVVLPGHCVGITSATRLHRHMISFYETNIQYWMVGVIILQSLLKAFFKNKMKILRCLYEERKSIVSPTKNSSMSSKPPFPNSPPLTKLFYHEANTVHHKWDDGTWRTLLMKEGVSQGCPLSPLFASFVVARLLKPIDSLLHKQAAARLDSRDPGDDGFGDISHLLGYVNNISS